MLVIFNRAVWMEEVVRCATCNRRASHASDWYFVYTQSSHKSADATEPFVLREMKEPSRFFSNELTQYAACSRCCAESLAKALNREERRGHFSAASTALASPSPADMASMSVAEEAKYPTRVISSK